MSRISAILLILLSLNASSAAQEEETESLLLSCDRSILLVRGERGYTSAMKAAKSIRDIGTANRDKELEARGLARIGFAEIHFGKWSKGWEESMEQAFRLTDDSKSSLARAETLMLDGYMKAMFLKQSDKGMRQLEESIVIGRSLEDDRFLAHAFRYLASIVSLTDKRPKCEQLLHRSVLFANRSGDEHVELVSRQFLLFRQLRRGTQIDESNRERVLELGLRHFGRKIVATMSTEARVKCQLGIVEESLPTLEHEQPDQTVLRTLLRNSLLLCSHYRDEKDWPEHEKQLRLARRAAKALKDGTNTRLLLRDEAVLLARQGKGNEALDLIQPFVEFHTKEGNTSELVGVYKSLAEQLEKAGDNEHAAICLSRLVPLLEFQRSETWSDASIAAENYVEDILQTRVIRDELREKRESLDQTLYYSRVALLAAPFALACLYFWRRSRRHLTTQKELRKQVALKTDSLRLAKEEAEAANHAKTKFVARINHELRNPLTSIICSIELLADAKTEELPDLKRTIQSCSLNLMDTVDDVLDFANIESGKIELHETEFSPAGLISEVIDVASPGLSEQTSLVTNIAQDVPARVHGDVGKLRQILVNLAQNAVRHTPNGNIYVRCSNATDDLAGNEGIALRFEVEDSGTGISAAQLETIFAEFKGAQQRSGSGLGLYISSAFASRLGGSLNCESEIGRGSRFELIVPLGVAQVSAPELRPETTHQANRKTRTLVIDDQPQVGMVVEKLAQKLGYESTWAMRWSEAEPILQDGIDIVLLDLRMPELSGNEILSLIRQLELSHEPRVIAVSGDATTETHQQVEQAGFDGFLAKPFSLEALKALLEEQHCPVGP